MQLPRLIQGGAVNIVSVVHVLLLHVVQRRHLLGSHFRRRSCCVRPADKCLLTDVYTITTDTSINKTAIFLCCPHGSRFVSWLHPITRPGIILQGRILLVLPTESIHCSGGEGYVLTALDPFIYLHAVRCILFFFLQTFSVFKHHTH